MSFRWYPIYQKGNPQLRVFLPNFWMKLVKPKEELPPNMVHFHAPLEMTEFDVKNYLEKIYKVPVMSVVMETRNGEIKRSLKQHLIKEDDYKYVSVTLKRGEVFKFPDINPVIQPKLEEKMEKESKEKVKAMNRPLKNRPGLPGWFLQ